MAESQKISILAVDDRIENLFILETLLKDSGLTLVPFLFVVWISGDCDLREY